MTEAFKTQKATVLWIKGQTMKKAIF